MSIALVKAALNADISPASTKLVLLALAEGTNDRTGIVWRSVASLAQVSGNKRRAAQRALHQLEQLGAITVVANRRGGPPGTVPVYRIDAAVLQRLALKVIHTGVADDTRTGVADDTRKDGDGCRGVRDGCRGDPETGVVGDTQTRIEPNTAREARRDLSTAAGDVAGNTGQQEQTSTAAKAEIRVIAARIRSGSHQCTAGLTRLGTVLASTKVSS